MITRKTINRNCQKLTDNFAGDRKPSKENCRFSPIVNNSMCMRILPI